VFATTPGITKAEEELVFADLFSMFSGFLSLSDTTPSTPQEKFGIWVTRSVARLSSARCYIASWKDSQPPKDEEQKEHKDKEGNAMD
jgi:hypothetical protein